jgi:Flp pilus assembly protein TadG
MGIFLEYVGLNYARRWDFIRLKLGHLRMDLKKIVAESAGSEVAEAALVLPLMFTILLGIFWLGRGYNIYASMNHAARDGARAAGTANCATCANSMLPADQVARNYVAPILRASGVDPALVTSVTPTFCGCYNPNCSVAVACDPLGTGANPSICVQRDVDIGVPGYTPPTCGTAVSFQYPFSLPLPMLYQPWNLQTVTLTAQAEARSEK